MAEITRAEIKKELNLSGLSNATENTVIGLIKKKADLVKITKYKIGLKNARTFLFSGGAGANLKNIQAITARIDELMLAKQILKDNLGENDNNDITTAIKEIGGKIEQKFKSLNNIINKLSEEEKTTVSKKLVQWLKTHHKSLTDEKEQLQGYCYWNDNENKYSDPAKPKVWTFQKTAYYNSSNEQLYLLNLCLKPFEVEGERKPSPSKSADDFKPLKEKTNKMIKDLTDANKIFNENFESKKTDKNWLDAQKIKINKLLIDSKGQGALNHLNRIKATDAFTKEPKNQEAVEAAKALETQIKLAEENLKKISAELKKIAKPTPAPAKDPNEGLIEDCKKDTAELKAFNDEIERELLNKINAQEWDGSNNDLSQWLIGKQHDIREKIDSIQKRKLWRKYSNIKDSVEAKESNNQIRRVKNNLKKVAFAEYAYNTIVKLDVYKDKEYEALRGFLRENNDIEAAIYAKIKPAVNKALTQDKVLQSLKQNVGQDNVEKITAKVAKLNGNDPLEAAILLASAAMYNYVKSWNNSDTSKGAYAILIKNVDDIIKAPAVTTPTPRATTDLKVTECEAMTEELKAINDEIKNNILTKMKQGTWTDDNLGKWLKELGKKLNYYVKNSELSKMIEWVKDNSCITGVSDLNIQIAAAKDNFILIYPVIVAYDTIVKPGELYADTDYNNLQTFCKNEKYSAYKEAIYEKITQELLTKRKEELKPSAELSQGSVDAIKKAVDATKDPLAALILINIALNYGDIKTNNAEGKHKGLFTESIKKIDTITAEVRFNEAKEVLGNLHNPNPTLKPTYTEYLRILYLLKDETVSQDNKKIINDTAKTYAESLKKIDFDPYKEKLSQNVRERLEGIEKNYKQLIEAGKFVEALALMYAAVKYDELHITDGKGFKKLIDDISVDKMSFQEYQKDYNRIVKNLNSWAREIQNILRKEEFQDVFGNVTEEKADYLDKKIGTDNNPGPFLKELKEGKKLLGKIKKIKSFENYAKNLEIKIDAMEQAIDGFGKKFVAGKTYLRQLIDAAPREAQDILTQIQASQEKDKSKVVIFTKNKHTTIMANEVPQTEDEKSKCKQGAQNSSNGYPGAVAITSQYTPVGYYKEITVTIKNDQGTIKYEVTTNYKMKYQTTVTSTASTGSKTVTNTDIANMGTTKKSYDSQGKY